MNKNNQIKSTLLQKTILVAFGLFLTLIILEAGLRLGGFIILSLQELGNISSVRQKGAYRILCLGESTTQGHWPPVLQEILNQRNIGIKFSVIDKGVGGINTSAIVQGLEVNIKQYQPNMVITMMGINDYGAHLPIEYTLDSAVNKSFMQFKTSKLIKLIMLHLKTKLKEASDLHKVGSYKEDLTGRSNDEMAFVNLGMNYFLRGLYQEAEKAFWEEIKLNPKNPVPYQQLRSCYRQDGHYEEGIKLMKELIASTPDNYRLYIELAQYHRSFYDFYKNDSFDFNLVESLLKKAIAINPKCESARIDLSSLYLDEKVDVALAEKTIREILEFDPHCGQAYIHLAWLYRDHAPQRYTQAEEMFKKSIEIEPESVVAYLELGRLYRTMGNFAEAETMYKKALQLNRDSVVAHRALMELYRERGRDDLAIQHSTKISALCKSYYHSQTINNYRRLREILASKRISYVCVQYPMRSIMPLQELFGEGRDGVFFVDNESSFRNAVKQNGYNEYFTDNFAGDFGHNTPKGDRLLAENIANVILKEVFSK